MLDFLVNIDRSLFFFFNGLHSPMFDVIMFKLTDGRAWTPLYLLVIFFLIKKWGWKSVIILVLLGIVITIDDRISSGILKPMVARLRPTHNPNIQDLVHTVNGYKGGMYSFVSSHAANAFGVATFLWLITRKKIAWIWVMFIYAIIFSYTRLYLGVHYPADIICGALLGASVGYGVYIVSMLLPDKFNPSA